MQPLPGTTVDPPGEWLTSCSSPPPGEWFHPLLVPITPNSPAAHPHHPPQAWLLREPPQDLQTSTPPETDVRGLACVLSIWVLSSPWGPSGEATVANPA